MALVNNQKAYDQYLLSDKGAGNSMVWGKPVGFHFQIRIPNFRGNYLSCVEELQFTLDGNEIEEKDISMLLNDKRFNISELPQMYKEYWNVDDQAVIEVMREGGLSGKHRIGVRMRLRYGYSAYFGKCKVVTSKCQKQLEFEGGNNQ